MREERPSPATPPGHNVGHEMARAVAGPWPLVLEVSGWPPSINRHVHWAARRRLEQPFRESIGWQARAQFHGPPLPQARVEVTFVHRSRRHVQDTDNLYARAKPVLDALKGILLVDDAPQHLSLDVGQQIGPARGVVVRVWPLQSEPAAPTVGSSRIMGTE